MNTKRMLGILLALLILISALPAQAFAATSTPCRHRWKLQSEKPATCARAGKKIYRCSICGAEKTVRLKRLSHSYGRWSTTKAPTCASEGEKARRCRMCGRVEKRTIDKTAHKWGEWTVTLEPTDFSMGTQTHTCAACGTEQAQDFYPDPTYKRGDRGLGVKFLQEKLKQAGYDCGRADGSFGGKTELAVKAIESAHGVTPDGIAWPGVQKWLVDAQEDGLVLTLKLASAEQETWAAGEEVSFDWTLVNHGDEDLILDYVFMDWGDDGLMSLCNGPLTMRANGGSVLSDTWTTALDADWINGDAWNLRFFGRGYAPGEEDAESYTVSNIVEVRLVAAP